MSVPYVIEKNEGQEHVYDLFSRLLKDRIVFIRGTIDQGLADSVVAQLLFLDSNEVEDINMYINSPGGEITAMYSIFDTMNYVKSDIVTLGIGQCCSAGSFLLTAGTKGKRSVLPNTNVMLHELSGGYQGKAGDMRNHHRHIEALYNQMARQYVKMTGQKLARIKTDMERDFYLSSDEAVKYGIVDKVQEQRK
jgi:ATP-dependent Clp protease protease subunit